MRAQPPCGAVQAVGVIWLVCSGGVHEVQPWGVRLQQGSGVPARNKGALALLSCKRCAPYRLLETGTESEEQLWSVARVLSGDEYEQVGRTGRGLAFLCSRPYRRVQGRTARCVRS